METFGDRIAWILRKNGLKKVQFAARLGIHQSYVSKLLKGEKFKPSDALVKLIASEFHVREEWLRDGTEPREAPVPLPDTISLDDLVKEQGLEGGEADTVKKLVQMYFTLKPETRLDIMARFDEYFGSPAATPAPPEASKPKPWDEMTREEKIAEFTRQLDEEERTNGEEHQSGGGATA